ncbi:hypothetical protein BCR37DRAFT_395256 [Protomyces lactucae-debilis]|uniref:Ribosomal protein mS38 C-terminal domain-containing protein n=1 Tax=Protomyces lactucae-debilis TaxID=2754530 RepID=A0A1Y2EYJ3_PROLT|nr:uncharacterized protein BCR37DRAFT_395256 [Protomyces lactucae-debilis]ORY76314.1 hypothetical protein BCR37DRAFT_395256 [Protomyces lactucae-debilis]
MAGSSSTSTAGTSTAALSNSTSSLFGLSQPAPNTSSIPPADISYSRFISRHGPLEVANRLLHPYSQNSNRAISLRQRQLAASKHQQRQHAAQNGERMQDLGESIIWQSATGAELELARIPHAALRALHAASTKMGSGQTGSRADRTSAKLWPRGQQESSEHAVQSTQSRFSSAVQRAMEQQEQQEEQEQDQEEEGALENDASEQRSMSNTGNNMNRVVVVPFSPGSGTSSQEFYENLMHAVESGLRRVESYSMTSTKRKRRLKMNKHKFKKRRKEQESMRKKLGK